MMVRKKKDDENNIFLDNIKKYLFYVIIFLVAFLGYIFIYYKNNNHNDQRDSIDYFVSLYGEKYITVYQGDEFIDFGYTAWDSKGNDLTKDVIVNNNVNMSLIGEYEITYTLGDIIEKRYVNVVERPIGVTSIYIKGDEKIYLKLGEEYVEPGYVVVDTIDGNLVDNVKTNSNLDINKAGDYEIIYSVVNSTGITTTTKREVIVLNTEINLVVSSNNYTNGNVTIHVSVISNDYDYLVLPDGKKVSDKNYDYVVDSNKTYKFIAYGNFGTVKEKSITINNIDKELPSGSCSGYFENGKSFINVNAKDNIGISKYVINNVTYNTNSITIGSELTKVLVKVYDKAGNVKDVSCSLEDRNVTITFDKNITLSYKYYNESGYMPYALFTPSTESTYKKKIPLIIWLHGAGEVGSNEKTLVSVGMPGALRNWNLYGFNAYVLCPHLTGDYTYGRWDHNPIMNYVDKLIDKIISEKNIDTDKIIISGHSLGSQGAFYMAANSSRYSSLVIYSGYYPNMPISNFSNIKIPTIGYVGTVSRGESKNSYNQTVSIFRAFFGNNLHILYTDHSRVPSVALNIDDNKDNKSDLIEWMLSQ